MYKDKIEIYIDNEKIFVDKEKYSAAELLILAKENPAETTLVLKCGNDLVKYKDDDTVMLKNEMMFAVFHDGPTSVSYFGPGRLTEELAKLGYQPELTVASDGNRYVILRKFVIPLGKFKGRTIELGMLATNDFPVTVASALHVRAKPQLYEKSDSVPDVRNIQDSALGVEWRYWSINFNWGNEVSTRRLISKINAVFQNA